jgi:hypothetical protein
MDQVMVIHPPPEPYRVNGVGMRPSEAIVYAATLLYSYCGAVHQAAIVSPECFRLLRHDVAGLIVRGGDPVFMVAGFCLAFDRGGVFVAFDDRVKTNTGWLRDPVTGQSVQITFDMEWPS